MCDLRNVDRVNSLETGTDVMGTIKPKAHNISVDRPSANTRFQTNCNTLSNTPSASSASHECSYRLDNMRQTLLLDVKSKASSPTSCKCTVEVEKTIALCMNALL